MLHAFKRHPADPKREIRKSKRVPKKAPRITLVVDRTAEMNVPAPDVESCTLCGAEIGRFDAETHWRTGHCAPCHEALSENSTNRD